MPIIHFLNVKNGDCSIIQHVSRHITVIDVCNAVAATMETRTLDYRGKLAAAMEKGLNGNFNQKNYPVNPILYMQERGLYEVFRFILTHPDMDHMDGIKALFAAFSPTNFWDTNNKDEKQFGDDTCGGYSEDDWNFYKALRDGTAVDAPKRLALYSGDTGQYWNRGKDGSKGGDGLQILAPTKGLIDTANECGDYNDCSYVILYRTGNHRILFAGDSHNETWKYIVANFKEAVKDVDLLIAPHHGRTSDRDWDFLDVVNPSLTLFGNADSEHLAYSAWSNRGLPMITNNQAGSIIINADTEPMQVYVTCEPYAKASNILTFYSDAIKGHFWGTITRRTAAVA